MTELDDPDEYYTPEVKDLLARYDAAIISEREAADRASALAKELYALGVTREELLEADELQMESGET